MAVVQAEFWTEVFLKPSGAPYSGVRVYHYAAGTSTAKTVYADGPMVIPAAQPVVGDTSGRAALYGDGDYRLVVKSSVADGDLTLYDWDPVKLTAKAATLRGENQATSFPAATSANRGQLFAKIDGSGNVVDMAVQKDTAFSSFLLANTTPSGTIQFAKGADLASASILNIGTDGNLFDVTGTVTITSLGVRAAGTLVWLRFTQVLNITYNATSLVLPYQVDYRTVANEMIAFISLGSGNWQLAWRSGPTDAPGDFVMTGANGANDGFVLCDGSTLLRSTYPGAFAKVGTTYGAGAGDGLSFSAPDFRGRSPIGVGTGIGGGASGTGKPVGGAALATVARGTWKGEETHTLTTAEMPSHAHGVTDPGHAHNLETGGDPSHASAGAAAVDIDATPVAPASQSGFVDSRTTGVAIQNTGSGGAHNTIQPVLGATIQMRV